MVGYKIEQIMPADGWLSLWDDGAVVPLMGWALITETKSPTREVVGLTVTPDSMGVQVAEKCRGFKGYVRESDLSAEPPEALEEPFYEPESDPISRPFLSEPGFEL
jgi:hypothetical protein